MQRRELVRFISDLLSTCAEQGSVPSEVVITPTALITFCLNSYDPAPDLIAGGVKAVTHREISGAELREKLEATRMAITVVHLEGNLSLLRAVHIA